MGTVDRALAADLRDRLGLRRAVETGTLHGRTARSLAFVFDEVITIELSEELHEFASERLRLLPQVRVLQGHSVERLRELRDPGTPTLYFLDGHWCGGRSAGADEACPVLDELEATGGGHADDCFVIDDARMFGLPLDSPHRGEHWPTLAEVEAALVRLRPEHHVAVLGDQVIAVPARAQQALDAYAARAAAD